MAEHQKPGGGTTQDIAGIAGGGLEADRDRLDLEPRRRRRGIADERPADPRRPISGPPEGSELTPSETNIIGGSQLENDKED